MKAAWSRLATVADRNNNGVDDVARVREKVPAKTRQRPQRTADTRTVMKGIALAQTADSRQGMGKEDEDRGQEARLPSECDEQQQQLDLEQHQDGQADQVKDVLYNARVRRLTQSQRCKPHQRKK